MTKHPPRRAPAHYFTSRPLSGTSAAPGSSEAAAGNGYVPHWTTVRARGIEMQLATGAGVFSKSGLDAGSHLLIETVQFAQDARLCDLGCGWGAMGCLAAALTPASTVWMCDINLRATELARLNIRHNCLHNATVWCGDGLGAARAASFDVVLCNPPVRAGNAVIAQLFQDAQRCLEGDGVLWVVLRTAQGAKSWQARLDHQFGNCETVAIERGYRVLKSIRR